MVWVNIFVVFILLISLLAGLKEGAVKHFFNLMIAVIAVFVAGLVYHLIAWLLSFLPGENWENFLGFFISYAIIIAILHLIFLVPRKLTQKKWKRGLPYRLLGGALNVVGTSIGLVVFALVLSAFPIFDWLARWVAGSSVMSFIVQIFGFVQVLLPEELQAAASLISTIV
ncbi:MAG: CvpA family protein [Chloroflexota bacterium]|nr:CvpA family protein [Chloroflexota bacterium]